MKISLAVTTFNRFELTIKSFEKVLSDDRISEVVILDDHSTNGAYEGLRDYFEGSMKVKVIMQSNNRGMAVNKADAISFCKEEWVLILDSDNTIDVSFLDAIEKLYLRPDTIYCPSFARPTFDYRTFSDIIFNRNNVKKYLDLPFFEQSLNTCNYLVYRRLYNSVFTKDESIKETDTLYFAYLWMRAGYSFHIVPGMEYDHLVHSGSGWLQNAAYNIQKAEEIKKLIRAL